MTQMATFVLSISEIEFTVFLGSQTEDCGFLGFKSVVYLLNVTLQFTLICYVMMLLLFDYGCLLVDALRQIVTTMGAIYWRFNADTCRVEVVGLTEAPPKGSERRIDCECHFKNYTVCHVVKLYVLT